MKKLLLILALLLLASPVWAVNWYVDSALTDTNVGSATPDCLNTYNPGTYSCGTGTTSAFKTIADINSFSTLTAGDQILFRRGQTWREQLTVPASGLAGNQLAFAAYGTGAKPIISGASITTAWQQIPATVSGGTWSDPFTAGNLSYYQDIGAGIAEVSSKITATALTGQVSPKFRKAFTAGKEFWMDYTYNVASGATIRQLQGMGLTTIADYSNILFVGVDKPASTEYFYVRFKDNSTTNSITTAYLFSRDTDYHIILHWKASTGSGANNGIIQVWANGLPIYANSTANNDTLSCTGILVGENNGSIPSGSAVITIKPTLHVDTTAATYESNLYQIADTTAPLRVWFAGTRGASQANFGAVTSNGNWRAENNILLTYTTDTTANIEFGQRATCINTNGQSYLNFQNLSTWYAESAVAGDNVYIFGNATDIAFDGVDANYGYRSDYYITGDGAANNIKNVTIKNATITGNDRLAEESPSGAFIMSDATSSYGTTGLSISNNIITGGSDTFSKHGIGVWVWRGTQSNISITNNTIHDLYGHGIDVTNGIGALPMNGTNVISGNNIYNVGYGWTQSYGGIGIGTDVQATRPFTGMTINNNSIDSVGNNGIISWSCNTCNIYYNKISNVGKYNAGSPTYAQGIGIVDPSSNLNFYNNTIYPGTSPGTNQSTSGIQIGSGATGATLKNNIVYGASLYLLWAQAAYTGDNNDFYATGSEVYSYLGTPYATLALFKTASSQEAHSLNADPLFVSASTGDFHLQPVSPAIDAGNGCPPGATQDFYGIRIPLRPNCSMGAAERIRPVVNGRVMH